MIRRRERLKGFPAARRAADGWSIFDADVLMPTAVLLRSAVVHNSASFAAYCARHSVSFSPHGKTTMSPELFDIQLRDGAWAITAATVFQARTMIEHGVPRVLIANEVSAAGDIAWLGDATRRGKEVLCCVDSIASIEILESGLRGRHGGMRVPVLVELGVAGGRTGARTVSEAVSVARRVSVSASVRLAGVSGFEGIIGAATNETAEERVDHFLQELRRLFDVLIAEGLFAGSQEAVISAGGSVFFDQVVKNLKCAAPQLPERIVIRSGCYLSHDDGVIDELSPLGASARTEGDPFRAALEVWGAVLSRPEPTRVIVGVGKRDASTDGLLPVAKKRLRRGERTPKPWRAHGRAVRVDDQHTYLDVDSNDDIAVGDLVGFGISHPCTTFDKWRAIPLVDDDYNVVGVANTRF